MTFISNPAQIEPAWLTSVLAAAGVLEQGRVVGFDLAQDTSTHAACARLFLRYSDGATGARPPSLFLKICKAESAVFGTSELEYYTSIAPPLRESPIPHCYHSGYRADLGRYHLLLEDLSESHHTNWGVEPAREQAEKAARALATIHAAWWDHPDLRADRRYADAAVIGAYRAHIDQGFEPMLAYLGGRISNETRAVLSAVFATHAQRMIERAEQGRHLTYIHGDPNPGNILSPNSADGRSYLIDRQLFDWSLSIWLGASDLAYMMVHWWEPEIRRRLEHTVLRTYHRALEEFGVTGYSWEHLWYDYRLAAMQSIYVATEWCILDDERSGMEWVWWPKLQKSITAFHDLHCAELLHVPG